MVLVAVVLPCVDFVGEDLLIGKVPAVMWLEFRAAQSAGN
jgi:hypothetical protein